MQDTVDSVIEDAWNHTVLDPTDPALLVKAAESSYLTTAVLSAICAPGDGEAALRLAANPKTPARWLQRLLTSCDGRVVGQARRHPHVEYSVISGVDELALAHPQCPSGRVHPYLPKLRRGEIGGELLDVLLRSPHLPATDRRRFSQSGDDALFPRLLANPELTHSEALAMLDVITVGSLAHSLCTIAWARHPHSPLSWVDGCVRPGEPDPRPPGQLNRRALDILDGNDRFLTAALINLIGVRPDADHQILDNVLGQLGTDVQLRRDTCAALSTAPHLSRSQLSHLHGPFDSLLDAWLFTRRWARRPELVHTIFILAQMLSEPLDVVLDAADAIHATPA